MGSSELERGSSFLAHIALVWFWYAIVLVKEACWSPCGKYRSELL